MSDPRQPPPDNGNFEKYAVRFAFLMLAGYVACFTFFTRGRMGVRYLGNGFCSGIIVQWLWILYYPAPELYAFFWVWLAVGFIQKIRTERFLRRGGELHRQDSGYAALVEWVPLLGRSDQIATRFLEPGLVAAIGYGLLRLGQWPGAAVFFLCGSLAMFSLATIEYAVLSEQIAAYRDSGIRSRNLSRLMQQRRR